MVFGSLFLFFFCVFFVCPVNDSAIAFVGKEWEPECTREWLWDIMTLFLYFNLNFKKLSK